MSMQQHNNLPLRGNFITRGLGHFFLRLSGWKFNGTLPNLRKQVVIVAPHTSNWDFVIGILVVFSLGIRAHWIGKHTLFVPPLNYLMEWLGGIPVNRSVPNDLIQTTTDKFSREEKLIIGIAPEGTRRKVDKWKKGYYLIASGGHVPITCASLDYRTRTINFGNVVTPSGDYEADFVRIKSFYSTVTGKYPDRF